MEFKTIKELFDIEDNTFGFPEEAIQMAENRLGVKFPTVLKSYYQELGMHQKLNQTQDRLIDLEKLAIDKSGVLVFYTENQHTAIWGIKKEDLEQSNPKVYRQDDKEWELDSYSLHAFFNSMAFMQATFSFGFHANICGVEEKYYKIIASNFKEVKEAFSLWNVRFYRNKHSELISVYRNQHQTDIFVTAKNKETFEEITNKFDFEWDYHSERDE